MSLRELKEFALGELGWSEERWRYSTMDQFNMAAEGYWRRWQRDTVWLMRELVFTMIQGNPYIKGGKPGSPKEIMKIDDDSSPGSDQQKRVSPEELEEARKILKL